MPYTGNIDGREILTIEQVCRRLRVTRRTVYNWMKANKVDWIRIASGGPRIFADSLVQSPEKCNRYISGKPKGPDADPT